MNDIFIKAKSCFGQYENCDNSWHCKGCPLKAECEQKKVEDKTNAE